MRLLLPELREALDETAVAALVASEERPPPPDRPWVAVNMISSLDGGTAVDGRSGGLGGPGDRVVFGALRAMTDCILVASGTVRAEGYRPPRPSAERRAERRARGQAERPRLAIVSGSLDLDLGTELFRTEGWRPTVVTHAATDPELRSAVAERAEVIVAGETTVDLDAALRRLRRDGVERVLCEGGPTFNGFLIGLDLVDELCLSLAPMLVAGDSARIAHGHTAVASAMDLARVLEDDGLLLLRYVRRR